MCTNYTLNIEYAAEGNDSNISTYIWWQGLKKETLEFILFTQQKFTAYLNEFYRYNLH